MGDSGWSPKSGYSLNWPDFRRWPAAPVHVKRTVAVRRACKPGIKHRRVREARKLYLGGNKATPPKSR